MKKPLNEPVITVNLRNDWFDGATLLRKANNPHTLPASVKARLPDSAEVVAGEEKTELKL